jgi:uroporphyrinogen-III synthase
MAKYKVLSTKKLDPLLVEQAKKEDIEIIEKEFISIKPIWNEETFERIIDFTSQKKFNIALTSANAVDVLNNYMTAHDSFYLIKWNIFCLSGKTKQAILNAKFLQKNIIGEAKKASELGKKIIEVGADEIIFFCGDKKRDELPRLLFEADIKVHEVVLYETVETPVTIDDHFDAILFFSPSGVQSFFFANELKENVICFSIGPTTATSISTFTRNKIIDSLEPDPGMMLEELIEYLKQKPAVK